MEQDNTSRYQCTLTTAGQPDCRFDARVTITDADGESARGCARHAVQALDGLAGGRAEWKDSAGLNEHEVLAVAAQYA